MIHKNIASALYESQLQTLNMLIHYIQHNEKHKLSENIIALIHEFKKTLQTISSHDITNNLAVSGSSVKQKKAPSAYNMFIRDKIYEFKRMYPESNGHDLMRMATSAWKTAHGKK